MAKPLIVIVGETASGKSKLAMQIAKQFNGEIICADSRTIYKGMDIGTAKPSKNDQTKIKHYLLDVVEPGERYSAAKFKMDALRAMVKIYENGKIPILVGGSGLYVDSVIYNYQFSPKDSVKNPINNRHLSSEVLKKKSQLRPNTIVIGLLHSKEDLNSRIEQRVEQIIQDGIIDEVLWLVDEYGANNSALAGIGYKPFIDYIAGHKTLDEAKSECIRGHKSLAKRQRTWFKRNADIVWVKPRQAQKLIEVFIHSRNIAQ